MAVQRQALIKRIVEFDTTPREVPIQQSPVFLIEFSQNRFWEITRELFPGNSVLVNARKIPVAAPREDVEAVLSSLLAPEFKRQAQPGYESGDQSNVHAEGQANVHPNFTCPELAGFRSVRSAVLRETWEEVRRRERQDEVITNVEFGNIMQVMWDRAKEATRSCPLGQGITSEL